MEMSIEQIKEKYKNEWVLVDVLEDDDLGKPMKVRLIAYSKNRDDTYAAMKQTKARDIAHFYTEEIPKKGYADGLFRSSFLRNFNVCLNFKEGILEIN